MSTLKKTREFLLQEKMFSIKDKVRVMDVNKTIIGTFTSKLISIGKNYRLTSAEKEDKVILTVKEKAISIKSSYSFFKGEKDADKLIGKLKKKLVSIRPKYWFEDPDGNKIFQMKGNLWKLKYTVLLEDKPIAEISKKFFKIKDTYGVRIEPDLDDDSAMLVLGIVVMLHHEKEEQENR